MKAFLCIAGAAILAGCASPQRSASLNADQAQSVAVRLANEKTSTLYQCEPFREGKVTRSANGHWLWSEVKGTGLSDLMATVELTPDGSAHRVDVGLLNDVNLF